MKSRAEQAERKDRTKFLKTGALFLIPIALFLAHKEDELARIPNSYTSRKALLDSHRNDIEVLILGSSHAMTGINPTQLHRKAFNLASTSQSLTIDERLALKYLDELPSLKLVIFTISHFSLDFSLRLARESWRNFFYTQVYGIEPDYGLWDRFSLKNFSLLALYTPEIALKSNFASDPRVAELAYADGWRGVGLTREKNQETGKHHVQLLQTQMYPFLTQENVAGLRNATRRLQKRGVQVVFVTLPAFETYRANVEPGSYEKMQETIARLTHELSVPYFNYYADARFSAADFFDDDHLNMDGSAKITQIIDHDVICNEKSVSLFHHACGSP